MYLICNNIFEIFENLNGEIFFLSMYVLQNFVNVELVFFFLFCMLWCMIFVKKRLEFGFKSSGYVFDFV